MENPGTHKPGKKEMLVDLQGQIERVTYTNDENGYTIAKLKVYGQRDLVTIVGNLMAPKGLNPDENRRSSKLF